MVQHVESMNLLLVEDEPRLREYIASRLRMTGYTVDTASDGPTGLGLAAQGDYAVILLDVNLPGGADGYDVARELRAISVKTPIVMLTGRDSMGDLVRGLDSGADDYVTKPFEFEELEARLRALDRRRKAAEPPVLRFETLELDPAARTVYQDGKRLRLTPTEFRLLRAFMANVGTTLSRDLLLRRVWDMDFDPGTRLVDVHVANLRRKLEAQGAARVIATVRGAGFRMGEPDEA